LLMFQSPGYRIRISDLALRVLYLRCEWSVVSGGAGFKLQVAGCRLQVAGCRLRVSGYGLQVAGCRLKGKVRFRIFFLFVLLMADC
jgi:hypothetical protein